MLYNYLIVSLRNIRKHRWFTLINVTGLTIGIAASLIVYVHIEQELSYDSFHDDLDRLYRITRTSKTAAGMDYMPNVPYPMINALHEDFTQFESFTQIHSDDNPLGIVKGEKLLLGHVVFADSSFFDVFSFKVLSGNAKKALAMPNHALLSRSLATRLFGNDSPVGEKIRLRNKLVVVVAGTFEDIPANSHLTFEMLVSWSSFTGDYLFGLPLDSWTMSAEGYAYVKLKPGLTPADLETSFDNLVSKYHTEEDGTKRKYYLQPLRDIRFDRKWNYSATDVNSLWVLGIIGSFILMIACVNFVNLSTAVAILKSKEVGIRKTLGAIRPQLIFQYLSDTFIITIISALLSIGLVERMIPLVNHFFDRQLELQVWEILYFVLAVVFVVTLLAGLYPALILSGYSPVKALKNNVHSPAASSLMLRKGLIIVQFFISQALIISTIVIANQMDYFISKPLGFDKEALITVDIADNDENTLQKFRDRLLTSPDIVNVSFSLGPPVSDNTAETHYFLTEEGPEQRQDVEIKPVDYHFMDTYGLTLKHGRWFTPGEDKGMRWLFDEEVDTTLTVSYIINEAAARKIGFHDPADAIGVNITTGMNDMNAPIVGVIGDYHLSSFREAIRPAVMVQLSMFYYNAGIKMSVGRNKEAIAHVQEVFEDLFPDNLFEYRFIDDELADFYTNERQTFSMFRIFSGLSIFISCLGLLGMISFTVSQRIREVGIRKVLGAKAGSIIMLFSKDIIALVLIAFLLAVPVAWYSMDMWLSGFAYKIEMKVWFFLAAVAISIIITFFSVGYKSWRAAMINPAEILKNE